MRALITLGIEVPDDDPQLNYLLHELGHGNALAVVGRLAGELRHVDLTVDDVEVIS